VPTGQRLGVAIQLIDAVKLLAKRLFIRLREGVWAPIQ